jgi:hypothetical protein
MAWPGRDDAPRANASASARFGMPLGPASQGVVAGAVPSVQGRESGQCALLPTLWCAVCCFVWRLRSHAAAGCQVLS